MPSERRWTQIIAVVGLSVLLDSGCTCPRYRIPPEAPLFGLEIARQYALTGSTPTETEGLVHGLVNRGVKREWFVGLGGSIEGDPGHPGARYLCSDGSSLQYRRQRGSDGFWLEVRNPGHQDSHKLAIAHALETGSDDTYTAFDTVLDLQYLYVDKDQRLWINPIARRGKVPLDPKTGRMMENP